MDYQEYVLAAGRASQLVERGEYEEAVAILEGLLASDISEIDKAMMCLNMALVCDKLGHVEQALAWYDEGVYYEQGHGRHYVAESKAAYLAEKGRYGESLYHYRDLLRHPSLMEADKARIAENIQALEKQGS
jgi:tetratricopeptide (TPR) repeat protein